MTVNDRVELVLDFARVLYINGQATEQTVEAPERLGRALGLTVTVMPRWGEMQVPKIVVDYLSDRWVGRQGR